MKSLWSCIKCKLTLEWDGNPGPDRGGPCPETPVGSDLPSWMLTADHEFVQVKT